MGSRIRQRKRRKLYGLWLSFSIKQKLCTFGGAVVVAITLAVVSNIAVIDYTLYGFGAIMEDNVKGLAFLEAVGEEAKAFETYIRLRTEENRSIFAAACEKTSQCVAVLPYDYARTGATRYARTWSVRNFYGNYVAARDEFLTWEESDENYITQLYQIYRLQEYLETYAQRLMQLTVREGNADYLVKEQMLYRIPYLLFAGGIAIACLVIILTFLMWSSLVTPLEQLAHASRKIARNEFPEEDLAIDNQDEMGELVVAFNKMKHATIGYIGALKEKYDITQLLHKEEMERIEMEKNLEAARLEVLKSQVNPHFLFNTLNMISCMARLEDAEVTDKMIGSLGNIFRYNLKTNDAEVSLLQEMKVVDDYMYLQQMRFGSRIQYVKKVNCKGMDVLIPSFSLQPIVENAIIHGLSKKEQGGKLLVGARLEKGLLTISVIDTGVGMDRETLCSLREALGKKSTSRLGIGLGNIYKRLRMLYEGADLQIFSKRNVGTMVRVRIPQAGNKEMKEAGEMDVPVTDSR